MRFTSRPLVLAFLYVVMVVVVAGCGGAAHVTGAAAIPLQPPAAAALADRFPGAASLLAGFERADSTGVWRAGDRVLLGLSFSRGVVRTDRLLMVELLEEPGRRPRFRRKVGVFGDEITIDSPTRATRLRLFEADGRPISEKRGQLAEIFLDFGPIEVARVGGGYAIATGEREEPKDNPRPEIDLEQLTPGVYGMMSLLAFGEGASESPTLSKLIERAFTAGQKLRLLLSWGKFEIRFGEVEPLAFGAEPVPGFVVGEAFDCEVRVSIGGREALHGRAVLVPAFAPLGLCGGIVSSELVNTADSEIRASVVLFGAIRGPVVTNETVTNAKVGG